MVTMLKQDNGLEAKYATYVAEEHCSLNQTMVSRTASLPDTDLFWIRYTNQEITAYCREKDSDASDC